MTGTRSQGPPEEDQDAGTSQQKGKEKAHKTKPDATAKYTPRQRIKSNFSTEDDLSILDLCGFGVCLLAEKIYVQDKTSGAMPLYTNIAKRANYLENLQGAITAAIQVVQTKGSTTNAKGEPIKITTNFVTDAEPHSEEIGTDWYEIWKAIAGDLGINLQEQQTKNAMNELLSGESIYKDLEQITQSQQTGLAKQQLGSEMFYPHYLGGGKKGATAAACASYVGFMALLNEAIRMAKALEKMGKDKKGPRGETEAMLGYIVSECKKKLPGGHGWVVDTLVTLSGDKQQQAVLESLRSYLGRYLGVVTPSREIPTLPQLVVVFGALLIGDNYLANQASTMNKYIKMFNSAFANVENKDLRFASYAIKAKIDGTVTNVPCRKLEVLLAHFSGLTFGNLDVLNEYIKKPDARGALDNTEVFTTGMLTFENITGGLGKMGKFNYFKKAGLERANVPAVTKNVFITVDFARNVKAAGVNRNPGMSVAVECSGDATQTFIINQPTQAATQQKTPTEYIDAMMQIFSQNVGIKTTKGQVHPLNYYHGIVMNLSARKDGVLEKKSIYCSNIHDLVELNIPRASERSLAAQQELCNAFSIVMQEIVDEGILETTDPASIKKVTLVNKEGAVEYSAALKRKLADLQKQFTLQEKKVKRSAGWSADPEFNFAS